MNKKAFTLAEVLITLGIIGVVAALTLPILIEKYQKQVTVNRLKKVYSMMKQIEQKTIAEYGDVSSWPTRTYFPNISKMIIEKHIIPYITYARLCDGTNCSYSYTNEAGSIVDLSTSNGVYLNDGTLIMVYATHGTQSHWGYYLIDVNGQQKPNLVGRDVFFAEWDFSDNNDRCQNGNSLFCHNPWNACSSSSKYGCFRKIMMDGWQIKSNYPW